MHTRTHTHSAHTYVHLHKPSRPTSLAELDSLLVQPRVPFFFACPDEYIIGSFLANNISVPTRYAAPPYHFQLDEHGVTAGLVENLNTMHEMENRAGDREGTLE